MKDLVSIIMPSYNTAKYIAESIQSVKAQTYEDWELLIVDDASIDDTDEVVAGFLTDSRIKYFKNEKNMGAALSRNLALQKARGKWIAFLDSDDLWLPTKLEKQIAFMKQGGYRFSYTEYEEIDSISKPLGVRVTGPRKVTRRGAYRYCWQGCLTAMYDREIVGLLQIEDIRKNNDYAMWLSVSKKADCYLLPECLAKYRRGRQGSVSTESILTMISWHYKLFRICEGQNPLFALFSTARNMFFGFVKKMRYVKIRGK